VTPHGGHVRQGVGRVPYDQGPRASGFGSHLSAEHGFLLMVIATYSRDQRCLVFP
jgi:hypothetical protein